MSLPTPEIVAQILAENNLYGPESGIRGITWTVLWAGTSLALVKSTAGMGFPTVKYRRAEVRLVSFGYKKTVRMTYKPQLDHGGLFNNNTVWTCDRKQQMPEKRIGRLTPAIKADLIGEAQNYEANRWPDLLAERIRMDAAEAAERQTRENTEQAEHTRNQNLWAAQSLVLEAALSGDDDAVLEAAAMYREVWAENQPITA